MFENFKQKVKVLKQETIVVFFALKDRRTPVSAKILAAIIIAYVLSPIDLIPDFIPVIGLLDDLILVPILISLTLKLIPENLMSEIRKNISNDDKLQKKWYFALPVILIYLFILVSIYFKFIGPRL